MSTTPNVSIAPAPLDFDQLRGAVQRRFAEYAKLGPLFRTDAAHLATEFRLALPEHERQVHYCFTCMDFFSRYGGLVHINEDGSTTPVFWSQDEVAPGYEGAVATVAGLVRRAKVTGRFASPLPWLGNGQTGAWTHFTAQNPSVDPNAVAVEAEAREQYRMLAMSLHDYPIGVVRKALALLQTVTIYRGEKALGATMWLADLHVRLDEVKRRDTRENLIWRAAATAPVGFCHIRSSMSGTLLDDLKAGTPVDVIMRRWNEKMALDRYMRPQAAPSAGNIAQAEKLVAELGIASSLPRRYARLEEIVATWKPRQTAAPPLGDGVFGHLKAKEQSAMSAPLELPRQTMTWVKFRDTVLPLAARMELKVADGPQNFFGFTTAVNPDAPPILQWDRPEARNPVCHYLYAHGSWAARWSLKAGEWAAVTALAMEPSGWRGEKLLNRADMLFFVLAGARDTGEAGGALFPETMKAALHPVRATIEAYSGSANLAGREETDACGLAFGSGSRTSWTCQLRVTHQDGTVGMYLLDRWD